MARRKTEIIEDIEGMLVDELQEEKLMNVLPVRNTVLFPGVVTPIMLNRSSSLKLVKAAHKSHERVIVLTQKDSQVTEPGAKDLYSLGVVAEVMQIITLPNDEQSKVAVLEGNERVEVFDFEENEDGKLRAHVRVLDETLPDKNDAQFAAIYDDIHSLSMRLLELNDVPRVDIQNTLRNVNHAPTFINFVCSLFDNFTQDQKLKLLAYDVMTERATALLTLLQKAVEIQDMKADIRRRTHEAMDKQQREYFLREEIETIKQDLGDTGADIIKSLRDRGAKKKWSKEIAELFEKELHRLEQMNVHAPDYTTEQNYIETLLELPWGIYSDDNFDLKHAQQVLDRDHYGLDKVKERIIEYLAVQRQLGLRSEKEKKAHSVKSPILCLFGPPGVGKTSLGKSVAEALGRKYVRVSLGGLHDESEIRGHRRTYIGAMPGRIVDGIKKCGTSNPVFVLDEVDKIGSDYKGDPTAALLEVLDPEQNNAFHDNYLDVDYDLSHVLFIATANSLDTIPRPLLDRMELIEMTGYLQEEKEEIAKRHLLPKELINHGLKPSQLKLKKEIIAHIIDDYTRESGVRNLERQIAKICRKIDTKLALDETYNVTVTQEDLRQYLGQARYTRDTWETNKYVGVVTGLAWTQVGGEILFIETSLSTAKSPTLTLTGNLGDVMKESATLALEYTRAHAEQFGIDPTMFDKKSVHIHVPEGAIPKDGPSAGITMTTAIVSAFTGRLVKPRIAMTGEMTLRGKVLPIGGVKEKLLAAKRAGITDIILCEENRKDVAEIPDVYLKGLNFHYVHDISEVINYALQ
ncbi:MAG: endopeptidase La [Paludibacteraceae bacterium]|nr:endopeptidase La [Paludibacteraceae bacterium]